MSVVYEKTVDQRSQPGDEDPREGTADEAEGHADRRWNEWGGARQQAKRADDDELSQPYAKTSSEHGASLGDARHAARRDERAREREDRVLDTPPDLECRQE
jgi:hypothetical protein